MKIENIHLRAYLLIVFYCGLSLFATAQTNKDNKDTESLHGKWTYEDAYTVDTKETIHLDVDNGYMKFYANIEMKEGDVFLTDDHSTLQAKYEVDGDFLGIEFPSGKTLIAEWAILEDELYMEVSTGDDIYYSSEKMKVILVYKRNK